MNICRRGECHTTAGCAHRGPKGELCWWPTSGSCADYPDWYTKFATLSGFSDDEIAAEYHRRALAKLGDQRIGISMTAWRVEMATTALKKEVAMSSRKIIKGLTEAVAHSRGEDTRVRERTIHIDDNVDVRNIRKKLSLTQQEFALRFGFSLAAVRHWEQGSRVPEMSARVLLTLIDKDPDYVRRALTFRGGR